MTTMTEEDKEAALAYMKLQDDVKQLIIDTIFKELNNYGGMLQTQVKTGVIYSSEFEQKVKDVIKNQMFK